MGKWSRSKEKVANRRRAVAGPPENDEVVGPRAGPLTVLHEHGRSTFDHAGPGPPALRLSVSSEVLAHGGALQLQSVHEIEFHASGTAQTNRSEAEIGWPVETERSRCRPTRVVLRAPAGRASGRVDAYIGSAY